LLTALVFFITVEERMEKKKSENENSGFMPVTKNIGNAVVSFPNLVPLVKREYRSSMMNKLKNWFCEELMKCVKEERDYCKKKPGVPPLMTQDKIDQLQKILDQCQTMFDIQALSNFVFLENEVPVDYEEVRQRGLRLQSLYPLLLPGGK
jgi:hypothetical protein